MDREPIGDDARHQFIETARQVERAMRMGRRDRTMRVHNHRTGAEEPWPARLTDENVASFWPRHNPYVGRAQALYREAREGGDNPPQALIRVLRWIDQELAW